MTRRAPEIADWSDMADERVFRSQLRRRVFRAILALPAIYRAPVMLRDIQGMSTEEASAMLRVKDQTLKSRLHRGRLILRKQLADFAGGLSHAASRDAAEGKSRSGRSINQHLQSIALLTEHRVVERDCARLSGGMFHLHNPARSQPDRQRGGRARSSAVVVWRHKAAERSPRQPVNAGDGFGGGVASA